MSFCFVSSFLNNSLALFSFVSLHAAAAASVIDATPEEAASVPRRRRKLGSKKTGALDTQVASSATLDAQHNGCPGGYIRSPWYDKKCASWQIACTGHKQSNNGFFCKDPALDAQNDGCPGGYRRLPYPYVECASGQYSCATGPKIGKFAFCETPGDGCNDDDEKACTTYPYCHWYPHWGDGWCSGSAGVHCGSGHRATSCDRCPYYDNTYKSGVSYCNGECHWSSTFFSWDSICEPN